MLKDYPEHIDHLQEVLNYVTETSSAGVDPFDRAIWVLEGRLETFITEARTQMSTKPRAIHQASLGDCNSHLSWALPISANAKLCRQGRDKKISARANQ